jgi:hypothetical protein
MASKRESVFVEREDEQGKATGWHYASLELKMPNMIILSSKELATKWDIVLYVDQSTTFEIIQITELDVVDALETAYGGGLGAVAAVLMSKFVKIPVIKMTNPIAEPGKKWVNIRAPGIQPKKTRNIARRIETMLHESGFSGMMLDLADEEIWKHSTGKILIGCVITTAIVIFILAVAMLVESLQCQ